MVKSITGNSVLAIGGLQILPYQLIAECSVKIGLITS